MPLTTAAARTRPLAEVCAELRERSAEVDRTATFSRPNWASLVLAGLTRLSVPSEFGGAGASVSELLDHIRAIGAACPSTGLGYLMHSCATSVLTATGSRHIRSTYLPRVAEGAIAAYAGTEAGTGTNFWALESCAAPVANGYRLCLRKSWATLAEVADLFLIPTRAAPDAGMTEISLFVVERNEGVSSESWRGSGMRGSSSGPVNVDAVVPAARMLGEAGRANEYITTDMFNLLLVSHAALYAGIAEEAMRLAAERARRRVFAHTGDTLCHTSLWQCRLGELSSEVQAGVALVQAAGQSIDGGESTGSLLRAALAAKGYACGLARRATDLAMQIFGGSGYNQGERIEMLWRDARAGSLMRPSDEVAQMILGRLECGLEPFA